MAKKSTRWLISPALGLAALLVSLSGDAAPGAPQFFRILEPACTSASLSASSALIPATGGNYFVGISADAGCRWTAASNLSWVSITSGASGQGNGTVAYTVQANASSNPRTGTLAILNRNFTLTQAGNIVTAGPWVKRFGGSLVDGGTAVAVDASGNILLAGTFKGSADFGGGPLTSSGGDELFLAKYTSAGVHLWSKRFGSTGDENPTAMALDAAGNIYVVGNFLGQANFGGSCKNQDGALTPNCQSAGVGLRDAFLASYSASGIHRFSRAFGGSAGDDNLTGVAVDSQGNVVVAGKFRGDVNFGGTPLHSLWGTAVNIVLARYSPSGEHVWSKTFACGNENYANGIAIDKDDNILLTGSFFTSINFASNDGLDKTILTGSATYQNIFLAKFSTTGSHLWSKRYGGARGDKGISVTTDGNGDVLLFGMYYKQTDLGNGPVPPDPGGALDNDAFIAKYAGTDGSYRWAQTIVGNNGIWANAVRSDSQNNAILTGYYYGTFTFGTRSLTSTLNSYDGFVARYSSSGALAWAKSFGGPNSDGGTALVIDQSNYIVLAGAFGGSITIDGTKLDSAGSQDVLLWRLANSPPE